ncbi:MAG: 5,6-dimethylbenzimidazole synthase [Rhodospirillales bacterium CG15_BIG_FIL_POST_REV_8_21_14_020_66_15]|nr:MAG: 5,6-dimethylbenzimidazole synthase [Rhodospirillales bacterium CG15_BIG_FIL_POST_REV_8_21_14_020_66_15]
MSEPQPDAPPEFDAAFRDKLRDLFLWRRDVRRFRTVPLPDGLVEGLLAQAALAPSVGNSQPWRFVIVEDPARRKRVRDDFETANKDALEGYSGERARTYAGLKLAGLDRAPVQLAVFSDQATVRGHGLGQNTMPEMLPYSVVAAVNTLWLAARAAGVGVGWVSIIHPERVSQILDVPDAWRLVAYLCLGRPEEEHPDPELVRAGWQDRADVTEFIVRR